MSLEIRKHFVHQAVLGASTSLTDGCLEVCAANLSSELIRRDNRIKQLRVETANPGESARIVCVKDAVEPRRCVAGDHDNAGVVSVLAGAAVVTCGPIVGYQEGIIDMNGAAARYTPFANRHLVVLRIDVMEGITKHEHEATVRVAGLRAAEYLAQTSTEQLPDEIEHISWGELSGDATLPRIAYVYMVLSQGLLHDTYVLGKNANEDLPMSIDPRIGMTNGIVSGNCVSACDKNTTYMHQNNPIIAELLRGHGSRWNFVGVVISNEPTRLAEKQESAAAAVTLVKQLRADGAIITKEGFGNPDADQMMIVRGLERAGIRTTMITDEFAGCDGGSQSLADITAEATAVVSTGNANQRIVLPSMQHVIGDLPDSARLAGGYPHSVHDDGSMEVELQAIIGATNQFGYGSLRGRDI